MDSKVQEIVSAHKKAKESRWNWELHWQAVADFFDINRATFTKKRSGGERRQSHLFDSTGIKCSAELAAIIHSIVTNPASRWFSGAFAKGFGPDDEAKEWLEECVDRMFNALNESNFNVEITLDYRDFCNFGTSILAMAPNNPTNFDGVRFRCIFLDEACFELDSTNRLVSMYQEHNLTLKQAQMKWPDAKVLTEEFAKKYGKMKQEGDYKGQVVMQFIEKICKRDGDYKKGKATVDANKPFERYIVVDGYDEPVLRDGMYSLYRYVMTWNRAPGEIYGRGPGFEALPDMRTLNEVVRMDLEAMAMQIKPPMKTRHNNVIGDIRMVPGGITVTRDPAGLMPFGNEPNVSVSKLRIEDLRASVKSIFLLDKLALPPRDQVGEMTAYEIQRRIQEMNQILGPILARINDERLQPLLEDLFYLMMRTGGFPEMPQSLAEQGAKIKFNFVNPLSLSQKAEEMAAVQLWLQDLMALANAGKTEVLDLIDDDNLARGSAEVRGVPQKYVTDKAKVEETRKQRQQMMEAQQQADIQAKQADAQYKMMQGADQGGRPEGT